MSARACLGLALLFGFLLPGGFARAAEGEPGGAEQECLGASRVVWTAPAGPGSTAEGWPTGGSARLEWGAATSAIVDDGGPTLVVSYPAGSINPGNPQAPEGGVGIKSRFPESFKEGCLSYEVRFDPGFDFGQGGKLPGLFGGKHNSGCSLDISSGFSARYMWGRNGNWFLYPYFADRETRCGAVFGAGILHFGTGRWYRISQYIKLNTSGQSDGQIYVWIDGALILHQDHAEIRATNKQRIEGVMVQTFFGGNDPTRASPSDQTARFRKFSFRTVL